MAELNENPFLDNPFRQRFDPVSNELVWELPETAERRRLGAEPFIKPMGEVAAPVPSTEVARLADDSAAPLSRLTSESLRGMLAVVADPSAPPGMVVSRDECGETVRMVDADGEPVQVFRVSPERLDGAIERLDGAIERVAGPPALPALSEMLKPLLTDPMRDYWEVAQRIRALYAGDGRMRRPPDITRDRWFVEGVMLLDRLRKANFDDAMLSWLLPPEILGVPRLSMPTSIMGVKVRLIDHIAPHLAFDLEAGE